MDSLTDVVVFVQVVDSGSFTAAADKLGLSKSVVSKYVTRLEDRPGARLLHRTTRRCGSLRLSCQRPKKQMDAAGTVPNSPRRISVSEFRTNRQSDQKFGFSGAS
jgi:hypothetical protein